MVFLKRVTYGFVALTFILMGGLGAQSNSMILQIGGFIGLSLGLVVLYMFGKMAWRAMGCIPSLLVLLMIILFVLYAIGVFNDGLGGVGQNLKLFLEQKPLKSEEVLTDNDAYSKKTEENATLPVTENENIINLIGEDKHPIIAENFLPKFKEKRNKKAFNPMDYPFIMGVSRVVKGDTLTVSGRVVRLYGVASPDITQTCADKQGRGYRCGQQSVLWLSEWLSNNVLKCHILNEDKQGVLTGVCILGQYDIGAAIINAGWAVADTRQSKIYLAYQNQASNAKRGLWEGKFYMPWDWQKIKNRKTNIKIIQPKNKKRKSVWNNLF